MPLFAAAARRNPARGNPAIADAERFGLVLPVIPYRDVDDGVERANHTQFGLSGSVWSNDAERAAAVAGELECGTASVDQHLAILPFTSCSGSGETAGVRISSHCSQSRE